MKPFLLILSLCLSTSTFGGEQECSKLVADTAIINAQARTEFDIEYSLRSVKLLTDHLTYIVTLHYFEDSVLNVIVKLKNRSLDSCEIATVEILN